MWQDEGLHCLYGLKEGEQQDRPLPWGGLPCGATDGAMSQRAQRRVAATDQSSASFWTVFCKAEEGSAATPARMVRRAGSARHTHGRRA